MTIHIPDIVLWMIMGAITIPIALYILYVVVIYVVFIIAWKRG